LPPVEPREGDDDPSLSPPPSFLKKEEAAAAGARDKKRTEMSEDKCPQLISMVRHDFVARCEASKGPGAA
jgi:hypothetical protein